MLDRLPIELVVTVLAGAAEDFVCNDRTTLLNIALSSSIGYSSVTPVLYRTLTVNRQCLPALDRLFEDTSISIGSGVLAMPAKQRLFPHVRRVFIDSGAERSTKYLCHLRRLEWLYSCSIDDGRVVASLTPTFTHYIALTTVLPKSLASTVTHVSYFYYFEKGIFQHHVSYTLSENVTHVAIELNDSVDQEQESRIVDTLKFLLGRSTGTVVAVRLYRNACQQKTRALFFRVLRTIADEDLKRVLLWYDARSVDNNTEDIGLSRQDALMGRTPWSEGQAWTRQEAEAELANLVSTS